MAIGYRSPWAFWRCPVCEGEGHLSPVRLAVVCNSCGEVDGTSETFEKCMAEERWLSGVAQRDREAQAERRRDEEARKVKISPKEWAE